MRKLTKPQKLSKGDKVATISLSWGGAGEFMHRYQQGKTQLQETFELEVVESKNALKSAEYIYKNPKARAEDLMESFADKSIKAIISNIGGDDSIRILPFLDLKIIEQNPKIFLGFSDTTISHIACYKAGLTTFYGTSLLIGFAETGGMHHYQIDDINKNLFSSKSVGQVLPNTNGWTNEMLEWGNKELKNTKRKLTKNTGWNFLQGETIVEGKLLGGCLDVLEFLKETEFGLSLNEWEDKIMFLETSEIMLAPDNFKWIIRNYAAQGIFKKLKGIIIGRPYDNKYTEDYNKILLQVIKDEQGLEKLPIITEMDFGHTCPTFTIPYGVRAEINCIDKTFSILESGVED